MEAPVYIAIVCPLCNEVRYRSSRPFVKGERPSPTDFVPENGAPEATISDTIPLCHECGSAMEPKLDTLGGVMLEPTGTRQEDKQSQQQVAELQRQTRSVSGPPIQTLFQPNANESILTVKDTASGLVIATTKRVVKVPLG